MRRRVSERESVWDAAGTAPATRCPYPPLSHLIFRARDHLILPYPTLPSVLVTTLSSLIRPYLPCP
eukprot:2024735-Rhodomonas_salina.1